jgi:hypothetical protein
LVLAPVWALGRNWRLAGSSRAQSRSNLLVWLSLLILLRVLSKKGEIFVYSSMSPQ